MHTVSLLVKIPHARRCLKLIARLILSLLVGWFASVRPADAYSVLTHEQLIDLTWQSSIVPLLLSRYPKLTPAQIEQARAYAYGGCVIQDIGYYPFGDEFFSNLTHYVRSGDFVVNLFRNAQNPNELAFAIGALSHYIGDIVGHSQATNHAVPIEFPKLRDRYGSVVNYAQGEHQHVQTEFAFDINEIAQHHLAPVHYLRHVGLEVPQRQVALAFFQTYGIREDFSDRRSRRVNVRGYRFAVRRFIPRIAYALELRHRVPPPTQAVSDPDIARLSREVALVAQQNGWDRYRRKPGIGTYCLSGLLFVLPKVGPVTLAAIKGPTPETETAYVRSVLKSEDALEQALHRFTPPPPLSSAVSSGGALKQGEGNTQQAAPAETQGAHAGVNSAAPNALRHELANRDLDTGSPVRPAGYRLTDDTYAALVHDLTRSPQTAIPPGIKRDVLAYYANLDLPFATRRKPALWATLQQDLVIFRALPTTTEQDPFPTYGEEADSGSADATPVTSN